MDDIVAVAVALKDGGVRHFMTWGRAFDAVDGSELARLVLQHSSDYALDGVPVRAEVCYSLFDAAEAPYFFEALLKLSAQPIPEAPLYQKWLRLIARQMRAGQHLYYLGSPKQRERCRKKFWSMRTDPAQAAKVGKSRKRS
jgi:hypothetical protein